MNTDSFSLGSSNILPDSLANKPISSPKSEPLPLQAKTPRHSHIAEPIIKKGSENRTASAETKIIMHREPTKTTHLENKAITISSQILTKRDKTFGEIINALTDSANAKIPFVNIFWYLAIFPIACFNKLFNPGQVFDTQFQQFLEDPKNRFGLESSLREINGILKLNGDSAACQSTAAIFEEGIKTAEQWRDEKIDKEQLAGNLSEKIISGSTATVIPGGYWKRDGTFEPVLYSFNRDKDQVLMMSVMDSTGNPTHFSLIHCGSDQIKRLLVDVLNLTNEPTELKEMKADEKAKVEFAGNVLGLVKGSPKTGNLNTSSHELSNRDLISIYIEKAGGKTQPATNESIPVARGRDPAKLAFEVLSGNIGEIDLSDKLIFSLNLMYSRLNKMVQGSDEMTPEQKNQWVHRLEKDALSIQKKMQARGIEGALLDQFNHQLTGLKKLKAKIDNENADLRHKDLNKLNTVASGDYGIQVAISDLAVKGIEEKEGLSVDNRISQADRVAVSELRSAFLVSKPHSVEIAVDKLKKLSQRVDQLVAQGDYEVAKELYRLVMAQLPPPSDLGLVSSFREVVETGFWKEILGKGDRPQAEAISNELGNLSQYFWEAKLKSGDTTMQPDEWIFMMNTEVAMHQLIRIQEKMIIDRVAPIGSGYIPPNDQKFEEAVLKFAIEKQIKAEGGVLYFNDFIDIQKYNALYQKKKDSILKTLADTMRNKAKANPGKIESINSKLENLEIKLRYTSRDAEKGQITKERDDLTKQLNELKGAMTPEMMIEAYREEFLRIKIANRKLSDLIPVESGKLTSEEKAFLAASEMHEVSLHHLVASINTFQNEKYLRPCENPLLYEKYQKIEAYLNILHKNKNSYDGCWTLKETSLFYSSDKDRILRERELCKRIAKTYDEKNADTLAMELHSKYYTRAQTSDKGGHFIPPCFTDLSRHQVMFTSLVYPTAMGHLDASKISGVEKTMEKDIIAERIRLNALNEIGKYARLEIGQYSKIPLLRVPEHTVWMNPGHYDLDVTGIYAAGSSFGKPVVVIDSGGDSKAYAEFKIARNPNVHATSVGNTDSNTSRVGSGTAYGEAFSNLSGQLGGFQPRSDASILSECLASNSPTAFDDYSLQCMKLKRSEGQTVDTVTDSCTLNIKEQQSFDYHSIHQVFNALLQSPWLLDRIGKNRDGADEFSAQKRLYEVLFTPGLLEQAFKKAPEYFINHSAAIKALMEYTSEHNNAQAFVFLLYLNDGVKQHLDLAIKQCQDPIQKAKLQEIQGQWPNSNTLFEKEGRTYADRAFEFYEATDDFKEQVNLGGLLLNMYANDLLAWWGSNPSSLLSPRNVDRVPTLLAMGGLLDIGKQEANIPVIAQEGVKWAKEYLSPAVGDLEPQIRDQILNRLVGHTSGSWTQAPNQTGVFRKGIDETETVVDLKTLQILKKDGEWIRAQTIQLPIEISQSPQFQRVFGRDDYDKKAKMMAGRTPGEIVYLVNGSNGVRHRLTVNKQAGSMVIERKQESKAALEGKSKEEKTSASWLRLCNLQSVHAPLGLEKRIVEQGIWINPSNPGKAYTFLGEPAVTSADSEKFIIDLNTEGKIKSIQSSDGFEVVHDTKGALSEILSCLPSEQMIFLRKPGTTEIVQIRFLNQEISLVCNPETKKWFLHGDESLEEAEWVTVKERGVPANSFLGSIGVNVEQMGFTVRKGDATYLLIWPHEVTSKNVDLLNSQRSLEFNKIAKTAPPLKIKIQNDKKVVSSSGGYLQLAYLFALRHDYAKAAAYIEKSRHEKFESGAELQTILEIESLIKKLPVSSANSAAVKLKGLLAVQQILREQTKNLSSASFEWKQFINSSQEINNAYADYQSHSKKSQITHKISAIGITGSEIDGAITAVRGAFNEMRTLVLTHDEQTELGFIKTESFLFALKETETSQQPSLTIPTLNEVKATLPFLLVRAASPLKEQERLNLKTELTLNEYFVIDHFFDLCREIEKGELTQSDLKPLFGPIPIGGDPQIRQAFDAARRILIAAAMTPTKQPNANMIFDAESIRKVQDWLPSNSLSEKLLLMKNPSEEPPDGPLKSLLHMGEALTQKDSAGKVLTPSGYAFPSQEKNKLIDAEKFANEIEAKPSLFGDSYTKMLLRILKNSEGKLNNNFEKDLSIDAFVDLILEETGINPIEALREQQVTLRISSLEKQLETKDIQELKKPFQVTVESVKQGEIGSVWKSFSGKWKIADVAKREENVANAYSMIQEELGTADPDLSEGMTNGLVIVKENLKKFNTIEPDALDAVEQEIGVFSFFCRNQEAAAKKKLLDQVKQNPSIFPPHVQAVVKNYGELGDEGIMDALTKSFQRLELKDSVALGLLATYYLNQTAVKVFGDEVAKQLDLLKFLKETKVNASSNEWISAATKVKELSTAALNFDRYLEGGNLKDPSLYCKVLALEAQQGIILTSGQLQLIQEMVANPCDWYELKVGMGKTSVIFPIVLMMLIEKGEFPVAVVKDALMQQNLDSLDRSTRELMEKAGVEFSFNINDPITPAILQEQYLRILKVEANHGYPITSISSIIAIDQKLQLLLDQLKELKEEKKTEGNKEFDSIQKEIYYLCKIKEKLGFLLIDEADDIMNVISENNVSLGEIAHLQSEIQTSMLDMTIVIQNSGNPEVVKLKEALLERSQAALDGTWVKKTLFPALVEEMLKNPSFLEKLGKNAKFTDEERNKLVDHICKVFEEKQIPPDLSFIKDPQAIKQLGALKHIIQNNMSTALKQNPGIEVGVKKSDGFQVGPQASGVEKAGTVFSDEYDLIVNHYLFYAHRLPESSQEEIKNGGGFAEKALKQIQVQNPEIYNSWIQADKGEDLIQFLNKPENYKARLEFLNCHIIKNNKIARKQRQMVFNVQSSCYGRRVGGMTGTRNLDSLPSVKRDPNKKVDNTKTIAAQVLIEAAVLKIPEVFVVAEGASATLESALLDRMKIDAGNPLNKAIINQGYFLEGGDAKAVVAILRQSESASKRIFVFVGSETRNIYIWHPGKQEPELGSKSKLNALAMKDSNFKDNACFYFAPADTRGMDFRIPPGIGVTYLSPRCSMDDFVQALGRMRGASVIHSMDFVITSGLEARILGKEAGIKQKKEAGIEQGKETSLESKKETDKEREKVSYGMIIKDISKQDRPEQQGKNLKTSIEEANSVLKMGTRQLLFGFRIKDSEGKPVVWAPKNSQQMKLNTAITFRLKAIAGNPITGWLEEISKINLDQDFSPTEMQKTHVMTGSIIAAARIRIDLMKNEVEQIENDAQLQQIDPDFLKTRVKGLHLIINEMELHLNEVERNIQQALENNKRGALPEMVPSGTGGVPTALSQIQQVQQQQQQQQQQLSQTSPVGGGGFYPYLAYSEKNVRELLKDPVDFPGPYSYVEYTKLEKLMSAFSVKVSPNAINMFNASHGVNGVTSLCRLAIKDGNVCMITAKDHSSFEPFSWDRVISFVNPVVCKTDMIIDEERKDKNVENPFYTYNFVAKSLTSTERQIAEAKFLLGHKLNQIDVKEIQQLIYDKGINKIQFELYIKYFSGNRQDIVKQFKFDAEL